MSTQTTWEICNFQRALYFCEIKYSNQKSTINIRGTHKMNLATTYNAPEPAHSRSKSRDKYISVIKVWKKENHKRRKKHRTRQLTFWTVKSPDVDVNWRRPLISWRWDVIDFHAKCLGLLHIWKWFIGFFLRFLVLSFFFFKC